MTEIRNEVLYEVPPDPRKEYETLNMDRCTEILVGYGVGPLMERIIRHYWYYLSMVARKRRYYGTPFKGHQWVTQGDPLPPTMFNMVVGTVISHWVMLVARE